MPNLIKNVGDHCVYCGEDTSFGSGRFINRVSADTYLDDDSPLLTIKFNNLSLQVGDHVDGWMCPECQSVECAKCGELTLDYINHNGSLYCPDCAEANGLTDDEEDKS